METRTGIEAHNWFGDIRFSPGVVVRPTTEDELVKIVKDKANFPSPVKATGSTHSVTNCIVPDSGTQVDMRAMNRVLRITNDTVVAQAGALLIDVARELEKHNLQFYVNIELGNLSMGAAACTHTKESSFEGEYGTVSSYAIGYKMVTAAGEIVVVTEEQPELLKAMRTSYGLLGLVYEVTFRVKPLRPLVFRNENFTIDEFIRQFPSLKTRGESMMYYLFAFKGRIIVEFRSYAERGKPATSFAWQVRNYAWATVVPAFSVAIRKFVPKGGLRSGLFELVGTISRGVLGLLRGGNSFPADQIIRYPEKAGIGRYTFSIFTFPEENFPEILRAYCSFCHEHYRKTGYRCDMPDVGYRAAKDTNGHFGFAYNGPQMTLDPVSTSGPGWVEYLDAYNEFCSSHGGSPLFNQTPQLNAQIVRKAYGDRFEAFQTLQRQYDPENRFMNRFFAEILGFSTATPTST